eukprot:1515952-Rhodomonas_salina.1
MRDDIRGTSTEGRRAGQGMVRGGTGGGRMHFLHGPLTSVWLCLSLYLYLDVSVSVSACACVRVPVSVCLCVPVSVCVRAVHGPGSEDQGDQRAQPRVHRQRVPGPLSFLSLIHISEPTRPRLI